MFLRRFFSFGLFLALTIAVHSSAAAALPSMLKVPQEGSIKARALSILDFLLHREPLLTVAGVKPCSQVQVDDSELAAEILNQAKRMGYLKQRDIGWLAGQSFPGRAGSHFLVYRTSAMERLIRDAQAQALLREYGLAIHTPQDVLDLFSEQMKNNPSEIARLTLAQDVLLGVFFGFPLADVRAYVQAAQKQAPPAKDRQPVAFNRDPEFEVGYMATFGEQDNPAVRRLKEAGDVAVSRAKAALASGLSPIDVFNQWHELSRFDARYCESLLRAPD